MTPPRLLEEIEALLAFKTTAFVPIGRQRNGVWNAETAAQKRVQFGQMFGALSEMGIKPHALSLGLLVLPQVWDLWSRWREERRGFYICWRSRFPAPGPGTSSARHRLTAAVAPSGATSIQDTAETVAQHYGRFLPKDKSALAAQIINKVWLETPSRPSIAPPDMALKEHLGRCAF